MGSACDLIYVLKRILLVILWRMEWREVRVEMKRSAKR